ncbi:MAG: Hpt domain-containing protein, partial [Gallionella sp.]
MTNNASFDLNALAAVKPGLDGTLAEIGVQLEQYFVMPTENEAALEAARAEARRLLGVLQMVGLDGAAVICAELELVLGELAAHPQQVTVLHREVLRQALPVIQQFLDALANGAANAALRLFPLYQELQQLRGMEMTFELDLFYPDLDVPLPQQVLNAIPQDEARNNLKTLRSQYQQALLKWLRQEDVSATVQQMLQALDGVLRCAPQDEGRAFWWIACGLLDCMRLDGLPPELNARKLLGRIDQQIRTVAEGNSTDVRALLNEMLYLIARSHTVSELVGMIKQAYALDDYLPEISSLPPTDVVNMLSSLRDELRNAEECWEQAVQGDQSACEQFKKHAEQLVLQSEKMERNSLQYLAKKILDLSEYTSTPEHARPIAIDMAMALLLLGNGIGKYRRMDSGFQEQARILFERMQAAIKQQPEDTQQLSVLVDLHCQMEQGEVMVPLANEMLANLQHVEQGLNAYFNSTIQPEELTGLLRLLSQIYGGLHISSLDKAEQLLVSIQDMVHDFTQNRDAPKPVEKLALANGIGALEDYMKRLQHGQASDVALLQSAANEMDKLRLPSASVPVDPALLAAPMASVPSGTSEAVALPQDAVSPQPAALTLHTEEDQELIDIFLEEAHEVLGIMRDNIEICQLHPESMEPLVTIRRGFHTLKGSGRMVGLTDFGEVAWCVERAMNKWLEDNKSGASALLLQFISVAVKTFAGWVDVLNNQGELHIDAKDLIAAAQQIENGLEDVVVPAIQTTQKADIEPELVIEIEPAQLFDLKFELEPIQKTEVELVPEFTIEPELISLTDLEFEVKTAPTSEQVQPPLPVSETAPTAASEEVFKTESAPDAEIAEEIVTIGEVTMSRALFNIASAEAVQNVTILQEQFDELRAAEQLVVKYDFMRAAHTLVGVSRTMGFDVIVDLANALEGWMEARVEHAFTLSDVQLQLLDLSITALGEMVLTICNQQIPQNHSDLVDQLRAETYKFDSPATGSLNEPDVKLPTIETVAHSLVEVSTEAVPQYTDISETVLQTEDAPVAKSVDDQAENAQFQVQDEIDEQLLPVFLEEADELCPKIGEVLRAWREHPQDEQHAPSLQRLLHTIKGSSRMVGAMRIGEIAHAMEDRVESVQTRKSAGFSNAMEGYWNALESDFDLINALLEELSGGKVVVMPVKAETSKENGAQDTESRVTEAGVEENTQSETGRRAADQKEGKQRADRRISERAPGNMLRVRSEVVDKLVNDAGEISVARSRIETELRSFKTGVAELTDSVMRLRNQLREVEIQAESQMQARVSLAKSSAEEFDPLELDRFTRLQELTRFMNESVHDVQTVQHTLLKNLDEAAAALLVQGRLGRELQQNLMNVRMVSFNSIVDRLYRIVRQTGKELNKRANLELQGIDLELDRSVLEKMVAPFEHLLRNSMVHGLESDQVRTLAGKNPIGEIRLNVRHEGNQVLFTLSDDGGGLNYQKLRDQAIARGVFQEGAEVSDDQLGQLIFLSGLSTASEITEIAGRGVGMDVVRSEITALGGTIDVKSKRGQGTQFNIRLPLTLAVTQILLVRSGESAYAIPSAIVEQVRQVKAVDMTTLHSEQKIEWQGRIYPLHYLSQLLSDEEVVPENHLRNSVLLLRSG